MKEKTKEALKTDMVVKGIPRVCLGSERHPYRVEVTVTRRTEILPDGLIEIHINKAPQISEQRASDVIQHALVDLLGPNPPFYMVELPNGARVPAYDWFDHTGQFAKLNISPDIKKELQRKAGVAWGRNSLWLVLNRQESAMRIGVLQWLAEKLFSRLVGRHQELREG